MYMYRKKCVWAFYQNKLDICNAANAADFQHQHIVKLSAEDPALIIDQI